MKVAIDVHYRADFAKAVAIEFEDWKDLLPHKINTIRVEDVAEYESGQFYKRELPCILKVLEQSPLEEIELIIVDGYVVLDDQGKPGLGRYVYEALDRKIPIIGVAKRSFKENTALVKEVFRGESKNPLFVSSVGIDLQAATGYIESMSGKYRMPNLLSILDQETKS